MLVLVVLYAFAVIGLMAILGYIGVEFKGTLADEPLPAELPLVSTVVPARNEERNIGRCASGIVHQTYEHLEMIFVDDDSEDRTGEILGRYAKDEPRLKVINTGGKPTNWNGKQWACHSGAAASTGDWLCFMDADTYAEPELIERTISFAVANHIDMLSMQPWYEMQGLWERIVLPFLPWLLLIFPPNRVNDPSTSLAMANGQFILIRRDVYEDIGGHEAIKQRMMDDFSLAEVVKGAGHRIHVVDGSDMMRVRLYHNLKEIRSGAIKAAVEISGGWGPSIAGLFVMLLVNVLPVILWLITYVAGAPADIVLILGTVVAIQLVFYGGIRIMGFRMPPWTAITYPIGALIVCAILAEGMYLVASRKEIKWKGRAVAGAPELDLPVKPGE